MIASLSDLSAGFAPDAESLNLIALLADGGDARLHLAPETGLNRYLSGPYPRDIVAFASSTANDLSAAAFGHLLAARIPHTAEEYAATLDDLRERLRAAYALPDDIGIVFAPSGTDLEYVALAAVAGRAAGGVHNILLGADEVGRGCIHSAHGDYFAEETALGHAVRTGAKVEGLERIELVDIPVRCEQGVAQSSRAIAEAIDREIAAAATQDRHAVVHVVHGSKTGLVLPQPAELDTLAARWGSRMSVVVDACQARIGRAELRAYLDRGAIVLLTGSKFIGGAPFSGFALVPAGVMQAAPLLPTGLRTIFRAAEWPAGWSGSERLEHGANPGLAARIEGAVFELERFQRLELDQVARVIAAFRTTLQQELIAPLGLREVETSADRIEGASRRQSLLMQTLVTLDVSAVAGAGSFDESVDLHRRLALSGIRLGQPVKSVRLAGGSWGGTLRIGLSMPQIVTLSALDDEALTIQLRTTFHSIRTALGAADAPD